MKKFVIGYYRKCDLLTMTGICSAFIGIILAIKLHFLYATLCMVISGVCDAFDGRLARKYSYDDNAKVYGVQLDSLSDAICFGAFPAILTAMQSQYIITYIICAFYVLCGVIRLAWFNTLANDENAERNVYIGVPITTVSILYPIVILLVRIFMPSVTHIVMPSLLLILACSFILNFRIKKVDIGKILGEIFNKYVVNFLIFPAFILIGCDVYFKSNFGGSSIKQAITVAREHFGAFLLLLIIVSLTFFFLITIVGNSKIAKIVSTVITVLLITINDIKFCIMDKPVQMSDVNYLNPDNMAMMGTATTSIGPWIWNVVFKTVVLIAILVLFIILDRGNQTFKFKSFKARIPAIILSLIFVIAPSYLGYNANTILLLPYGVTPDTCNSLPEIKELYYEYGYLQGFFLDYISPNYNKPTNYSKTKTDKAIIEAAKNKENGTWGKANVVFILSEAFSEIENISEVEFNKNLTPFIDSISDDEDKMVFDLFVNCYGSISVNTEFEMLTGSSTALWPYIIPYTTYYNEENAPYAPNVISEFNNNGYHTMYLTPWGQTSYKSEYVYSLFGADEMVYGDSLRGNIKGNWYSDESFMKDIYNELKETSVGNYKFIMSATGQNHYPYDVNIYDHYDITVNSDTLNDEDKGMIQTYAQGIYDADKELKNLYEMIQTIDVPTVVVFYGDHLPYIVNSNGGSPYLESDYFNTEDEALNYFRQFTTKGVILANFDLDTSDDFDYLNASYLGTYVLNKLDLDISDYFKYIDTARKVLPVFSREYAYLDGELVPLKKLNGIEKDTYYDLRCVRYRSFYDYLDD